MKSIKRSSILNKKTKRYLLYALGEILLIVVGILLALYINNRNTNKQYKDTIDNNIIRVYYELEKNIEKAKSVISRLERKDSLIYLVMNDSLEKKDYTESGELATLILNSNSLEIEDKSYQNLIQLNISDNRYNEELITELTELYSSNKKINELNQRMRNFINDKSIPLIIENADSYGDLIYRSRIEDDLIDYYLTSKGYKSNVSFYGVVAIRNQLWEVEDFYRKAIGVYNQIGEQYELNVENFSAFNKEVGAEYGGLYYNERHQDTLKIIFKNDSLFFQRDTFPVVNVVPFEEHRFFTNYKNGMFMSFFKNEKDTSGWNMNIHLLNYREAYEKMKGE